MDMKDIYENGCFSPAWLEKDEEQSAPKRKELGVLLGELEEIKNNIEKLQAKQWYLARLIMYHNEGFAKT